MRRPLVCLVVTVQLASFALVGAAFAVSDDALRCQVAIGEAGREYAVARLRVLVACNNATAAGESCGPDRRARVVGRAADAIARTTADACRDVALETLHFPGGCPDDNGGSFTWSDLLYCLEAVHNDVTNDALGFEYPALQTFSGDERRCQRGLARAASAFLVTDMRVRTRCLDARLRGALPEAVDCFAEIPPHGEGTGDTATDDAVRQATTRLTSRLAKACVDADLTFLGFPGRCTEAHGGEIDRAYAERCMRTEHARLVRFMLAIEYPRMTPSPTPAATPTPVVESLRLAPTLAQKAVGAVQNFSAIAHMSDGADRNFTQRVYFSSSEPSVAFCPNTDGNRGRVETVGPGTALITATEPATAVTSDAATLIVVTGCIHNKCVTGVALPSNCEPCVTTICAVDPSCCADAWAQSCVDAVSSLCDATCPATGEGG